MCDSNGSHRIGPAGLRSIMLGAAIVVVVAINKGKSPTRRKSRVEEDIGATNQQELE